MANWIRVEGRSPADGRVKRLGQGDCVKTASIVAVLILLAGAVAHAQAPRPQSFRVEWEPRTDPGSRPGVEGYVYNDSEYRVGSVRLRLEILEAASQQVVGERFSWVYGHVPPRGRTFFVVPPPGPGQTYRITVESFDLIARESPRESP